MVDVGEKTPTLREATACGRIKLSKAAFNIMTLKKSDKGDVLGIARIAGILAAKRTSELIPLCHSIPISQISKRWFI